MDQILDRKKKYFNVFFYPMCIWISERKKVKNLNDINRFFFVGRSCETKTAIT